MLEISDQARNLVLEESPCLLRPAWHTSHARERAPPGMRAARRIRARACACMCRSRLKKEGSRCRSPLANRPPSALPLAAHSGGSCSAPISCSYTPLPRPAPASAGPSPGTLAPRLQGAAPRNAPRRQGNTHPPDSGADGVRKRLQHAFGHLLPASGAVLTCSRSPQQWPPPCGAHRARPPDSAAARRAAWRPRARARGRRA